MPLFDAGARPGHSPQVSDRWLTVPNLITALRLLGLPVFVWFVLGAGRLTAGFVTLAVIAATDWVDGYVARRFDQVSRVGQLADPLIDRLLLAVAAVTLLLAGVLPAWIVVAVLARDVLLLGGALVWFGRIPPIAVSRLGKFATAMLLIGVPGFLLAAIDWVGASAFEVLAWGLVGVGLPSYYLAGAAYARAAWAYHHGQRPA